MLVKAGLALLLIVGYVVIMRLMSTAIRAIGFSRSVNELRVSMVSKLLSLGLTAVFVLLLCLILGVEYGQLAVFFSSVFAVVGVALFAQWSILSNITASLIIFFSFPYRVGNWVKIVDKDEEILGQIHEISTFHVIITRVSGDTVTYPNNLILQKAVICFRNEEEAKSHSSLLKQDSEQSNGK